MLCIHICIVKTPILCRPRTVEVKVALAVGIIYYIRLISARCIDARVASIMRRLLSSIAITKTFFFLQKLDTRVYIYIYTQYDQYNIMFGYLYLYIYIIHIYWRCTPTQW